MFDDMTVDVEANETSTSIVTELFLRGSKLSKTQKTCFYIRILFQGG